MLDHIFLSVSDVARSVASDTAAYCEGNESDGSSLEVASKSGQHQS